MSVDWSEAIEQHLPARRDDEPESLRRDIADELGDHLACALEREQRRCPDEQTARNSVLERFGDPGRIARQLWLEWMKGKIMTQRINLAALAVVAVASIAAASLSWYTLQETRDVTSAILSKLEGLAETRAEPQLAPASEWTQLEVRCVQGTTEGPPARGFRVELWGPALGTGSSVTLSEVTDSDGRAAFSPVRIGQYRLVVKTPGPAKLAYTHTRQIVLLPKLKSEATVVCPAERPRLVDVAFQIDWPAETVPEDVIVGCYFRWNDQQIEVDGDQWQFLGAPSAHFGAAMGESEYGFGAMEAGMMPTSQQLGQPSVILTPQGKIIAQDLGLWRSPGAYSPGFGGGFHPAGRALGAAAERTYAGQAQVVGGPFRPAELVQRETVRWQSGRYTLHRLVLFQLFKDAADPEKAYLRSDGIVDTPRQQEFLAEKGRKNLWTISVPEPLLQRLTARGE